MRENDDLDLLLDSAIKTYADTHASPDLEQRVLARIAAESVHAPRRRWLVWAIAAPLAACLLLFLLLMSQRSIREPNQVAQIPSAPSLSGRSPMDATHPSRVQRAHAHSRAAQRMRVADRAASAALPKLDVFPAPQPLTPQEQALVTYISRASAAKIQALIKKQNEPEQPLNISALRILPLEPPDEGNK